MVLFLVDDSLTPFWDSAPPGVWDGFAVRPLSGRPPGVRIRPYSSRYADQIAAERGDDEQPFCVVTDARFGESEPFGGITLLNLLVENFDERFVRGCVYSTDPGSPELVRDEARCLLYKCRPTREGLEDVATFLRTGRRLVAPAPAVTSALSQAAHALRNFALEVEAGTLRQMVEPLSERDRKAFAEIEAEYFAPGPDGKPELVGRIRGHLVGAVGLVPPAVIDEQLAAVEVALGGADATPAARAAALTAANAAVSAIVAALGAACRPSFTPTA
jgi:hypothetical protein